MNGGVRILSDSSSGVNSSTGTATPVHGSQLSMEEKVSTVKKCLMHK